MSLLSSADLKKSTMRWSMFPLTSVTVRLFSHLRLVQHPEGRLLTKSKRPEHHFHNLILASLLQLSPNFRIYSKVLTTQLICLTFNIPLSHIGAWPPKARHCSRLKISCLAVCIHPYEQRTTDITMEAGDPKIRWWWGVLIDGLCLKMVWKLWYLKNYYHLKNDGLLGYPFQ